VIAGIADIARDRRDRKQDVLTAKGTRSIPLSQPQGRSGQATEREGNPEVHAKLCLDPAQWMAIGFFAALGM